MMTCSMLFGRLHLERRAGLEDVPHPGIGGDAPRGVRRQIFEKCWRRGWIRGVHVGGREVLAVVGGEAERARAAECLRELAHDHVEDPLG